METKSDKDWLKLVRDQCGFKQSFVVPSIGLSGGLALFWKEGIKMEVNKSGLSHIDAFVRGDGNFGQWHLTGFYGNPDMAKRAESWELLKSLCGPNSLPWLIIGDFNKIVCVSEKYGGAVRPIRQMAQFKEVIDFCGLREVGFVGPQYTWLYQKHDGSQIRERLDRVLATQEWLTLFPSAKLFHKSSSVSDHSPLLLSFLHKPKKKKEKKRSSSNSNPCD